MAAKIHNTQAVSDEDEKRAEMLTAKIVAILKLDSLESVVEEIEKDIKCKVSIKKKQWTLLRHANNGNCSQAIIPLLLEHPFFHDCYMQRAIIYAINSDKISDHVLCKMIGCEDMTVNSRHLIRAIEKGKSSKIIDALLERPEVDIYETYRECAANAFISAVVAGNEETIRKLINHESYEDLDNHIDTIIKGEVGIDESLHHVLRNPQLYLQSAGGNVADKIFGKLIPYLYKSKSLQKLYTSWNNYQEEMKPRNPSKESKLEGNFKKLQIHSDEDEGLSRKHKKN